MIHLSGQTRMVLNFRSGKHSPSPSPPIFLFSPLTLSYSLSFFLPFGPLFPSPTQEAGEFFEDLIYKLDLQDPGSGYRVVRDVRTDPGELHVISLDRQPMAKSESVTSDSLGEVVFFIEACTY